MVTESLGNIYPNNSSSNSVIKRKYFTPKSHDILCDGVYCTEDSRYAIYHYYVGKLIIHHHYFIFMFKLLKFYTIYAPHHIIMTDTSMFIHCPRQPLRPINRPPRIYVPNHLLYWLVAPQYNWTWLLFSINMDISMEIDGKQRLSILYLWFCTLCWQLSWAAYRVVQCGLSMTTFIGCVTPVYGS